MTATQLGGKPLLDVGDVAVVDAWDLRRNRVTSHGPALPSSESLTHGAVYDYCRVVLAFDITEGEIEGTDVAGLKIAAIADTPKVMTDGNWRIGVLVDANASDEQADKLVAVFSGRRPDGCGT